MSENPNNPPGDDEEDLSIDERARLWLTSIPRREGLRLVHMPRHQVKAFLAAATLNAGTADLAKKLQARLSFSASVINVPAKSMLELVEAYITTSITDTSGPKPGIAPIAAAPTLESAKSSPPNAPVRTIGASDDSQVDQAADASEGQKTT